MPFVLGALIFASPSVSYALTRTVYLSDFRPIYSEQAWGPLGRNVSVEGLPIILGGKTYAKGIGTHAQSKLLYALPAGSRRFSAVVGIDNDVLKYRETKDWAAHKPARGRFRVVLSGKTVFDSGKMLWNTTPKKVDLPLNGAPILTLIVDQQDGDNYGAHADWADAKVTVQSSALHVDAKPAYKLNGQKLSIQLNRSGQIVGLRCGNGKIEKCFGQTEFGQPGDSQLTVRQSRTSIAFLRRLPAGGTMTETFETKPDGVQWTTVIKTFGKPYTQPLETKFQWLPSKDTKYWTATGGPAKWEDPLALKPLANVDFEYGAFFSRPGGVSLPIISLIDEKKDRGISVIASPEDRIINALLYVQKDGTVRFQRVLQRFGEGRVWKSTVTLLPHEGDFKPGLRYMVDKYPDCFRPGNPRVSEITGHGAYSGFEGDIDSGKLQKMGYSFNWKASIDFPYMGMFLPPIPADVQWNRFAGGGGGGYTDADEGRFGKTTINQLNDYAKRMKLMGFHVLSYFNVTEFGGNIAFPKPTSKWLSPNDLWRNPNDYLYANFPDAMIRFPDRPYWTWGGAVVMDPGDKPYQDFLIDQARRHINELPATDGICIDRIDWINFKNPNADDGVTWIEGPQRNLTESWRSIMTRMVPLMHSSGKVIYGNCMTKRPDISRYLDGIYDEIAETPYNLNATSFLCLAKPMTAWTSNEALIRPDPDAFFQRHLYLGTFMTVPMPGNDHTLLPSDWLEKLYLDYGDLFKTLKGREWFLAPHAVRVLESRAKANVFKTPAGYVVMVMLGGKDGTATIRLNGLPKKMRARTLHPGEAPNTKAIAFDTDRPIYVPLVRGCAALVLTKI